MDHMAYLIEVSESDLRKLHEKEATYKGSWKKRGGVGAFMMLARKWDRLENMAENHQWDIFTLIKQQGANGEDGTVLAEIRDLRRYLMLIEAEILSLIMKGQISGYPGSPERLIKKAFPDGTPKEDSNKHAAASPPDAGLSMEKTNITSKSIAR